MGSNRCARWGVQHCGVLPVAARIAEPWVRRGLDRQSCSADSVQAAVHRGTATLLGYGHYLAYFAPKKACADSSTCETLGTTRWMKLILWGATALALAGLSLEYVEPYLIG